jgi:hypothetical protein
MIFLALIVTGGVVITEAVIGTDKSTQAKTIQNDNIHRAQQSFNIDTVDDGSQITSIFVDFTLDSNIGDQCVLMLNESHLRKDPISSPFTCSATNDIELETKGIHALQTKLRVDSFEIIVKSLTTDEIVSISSDQLNLDITYQPPRNFAQIENGIVVNVIVSEQSHIDTLSGLWIEADFNVNPIGVGDSWDAVQNKFIKKQPYPSWSLDVNDVWQPPTPKPNKGVSFWNEDLLDWVG